MTLDWVVSISLVSAVINFCLRVHNTVFWYLILHRDIASPWCMSADITWSANWAEISLLFLWYRPFLSSCHRWILLYSFNAIWVIKNKISDSAVSISKFDRGWEFTYPLTANSWLLSKKLTFFGNPRICFEDPC